MPKLNAGGMGIIDPDAVYREMARWGWNTTKLARMAGISRETLSKALNGHSVSKTTLYKIGLTLRLESPEKREDTA